MRCRFRFSRLRGLDVSYPLDVAAQNAALDALLSLDVSGLPTMYEVALYDVHPLLGGVELSATGGYARPTLNADLVDFPAAASGLKTSVPVSFGTSTGAYSDTATYYVLYDAADSTTRWYYGLLTEEVSVDAAGTVVEASLALYWNTES